jgi:hypothetical protein
MYDLIGVLRAPVRRVSAWRSLSALVLVPLLAGPALGQEPTPLQGDWERIFMRITLPDTTIERTFEDGERSIKILTATRFAYGVQSEDGNVASAGGGRYSLARDNYIETFEYNSSAFLVGRVITFESRREGELWHISGVLGRFKLEETWRPLR